MSARGSRETKFNLHNNRAWEWVDLLILKDLTLLWNDLVLFLNWKDTQTILTQLVSYTKINPQVQGFSTHRIQIISIIPLFFRQSMREGVPQNKVKPLKRSFNSINKTSNRNSNKSTLNTNNRISLLKFRIICNK